MYVDLTDWIVAANQLRDSVNIYIWDSKAAVLCARLYFVDTIIALRS